MYPPIRARRKTKEDILSLLVKTIIVGQKISNEIGCNLTSPKCSSIRPIFIQ